MLAGLAMAAAISVASNPRPTPSAFVSEQYGLTFLTPQGSTYCALPDDWVGSDHGTVVFLAPPKRCYGAGYPSSGRGFDGNAPRVEVFYAYDIEDEPEQEPIRCKEAGRVMFLGKVRPLCRRSSHQRIEVSISAKYSAESPAQTTLTLVTTLARLEADLRKFKTLLQSARTCTATWRDDKGGKPFTTGSGPACPSDARWF